ncbi:MAG: TIGR03936 family radical SAM-associated protein [Clostridiales bacterium]|nr:TIGR03936 family radical SAM-associated protein [Clostridiales bacterium]
MRCVRIWFTKTGRVKYISHLDIMRCMTRAVRRADIPLWYTEGFNPHPYLNFLLPLSLGIEGMNEPLDIRIEGDISNGEIKDKLNAVLPEGITVANVTDPYLKASDIAFGEYEIVFERDNALAEDIDRAMKSGELSCEKTGKVKGKKSVKTINVSECIERYAVTENDDTVVLNVILPGGNEKNLNPAHLTAAIGNYLKKDLAPLNVKRLKLLDKNLLGFE